MSSNLSMNKSRTASSPLVIFTVVNTLLVLAFIGLYLGLLFGYLSRDWVEAKNCVAPIGEFTVEPSVDVGTTLESCPNSGFDDKGTCIYNNVPTLLQATRICNQQADICSRFVYNSSSQKMKIVSLQGTPNRASQDDNTYTRQANVTFRTSGSGVSNTTPSISSDTSTFTINSVGDVIPNTSVVESFFF